MKKVQWLPRNNKSVSDDISLYLSSVKFSTDYFGRHHYDLEACQCNDRVVGNFELLYIVDGRILFTVDGYDFVGQAGDMVLIRPFTLHKFVGDPKSPPDVYWVHFDILPFFEIFKIWSFTPFGLEGTCFSYGIDKSLIYLMDMAFQEHSSKRPGSYAFCNSTLCQIFALLLRRQKDESCFATMHNKRSFKLVDQCMSYLERHLCQDVSIDDLCCVLGVSPSTLFKSFVQVTGLPPMKLFQYYKMKYAETLLLSTQLSIQEVAQQTGFHSSFYFCNVFKSHFSMPPSQYRRKFQ